MKAGLWLKCLLLCVLTLGVSNERAWARDHGQRHFGVLVGPMWGPYYAPRPFFDYPPYRTVVIEPVPLVYIEQAPRVAPDNEATRYWYYCAETRAYYPYINQCPGGWIKVLPQVPAQ